MRGETKQGEYAGIWDLITLFELMLLWRDQAGLLTVLESSEQFIHARVMMGTEAIHLIAVYAAPTVSRRSGLWGSLKQTLESIVEPVLVGVILILF